MSSSENRGIYNGTQCTGLMYSTMRGSVGMYACTGNSKYMTRTLYPVSENA